VIPVAFEYERPETLDAALALLAEHGEDAKVLAGGHSLLPVMKLRLAAPELVIDIGRLAELRYARVDGDEVAIGAGARHHDLATSDVVTAEAPLLAAVARTVGDPQVRHRGTIGGSLAHADPASDEPAAVLALGGSVVLRGPRGERRVPVTEFFTGLFETAAEPDELIVEVRVPRTGARADGASAGRSTSAHGWAYEKFTRRANDWAIVGVAVVDGRVGLVNMGSTTLRAAATEAALADGRSIADAAALAAEGTEPPADLAATPDYRRHLARVLTRRALTTAAGAT
jgi:aerobic carbon-monoxide dehydrogenase medium subunit